MADSKKGKNSGNQQQQSPQQPKVVSKEEAERTKEEAERTQSAYENPPGYARDEEKRKRADALEEAMDKLTDEHSDGQDVHKVDPAALEEDREIQYALQRDGLEITDAQSDRRYAWVNFVNQNGAQVWRHKALGFRYVRRDDPECRDERMDAEGFRKVGDVVLMWLPQQRAEELRKQHLVKRLRRKFGGVDTSAIDAVINKYPNALKRREDLEQGLASGNGEALQKAGARQTAMGQLDKMVREGTVPGIKNPGGNRR